MIDRSWEFFGFFFVWVINTYKFASLPNIWRLHIVGVTYRFYYFLCKLTLTNQFGSRGYLLHKSPSVEKSFTMERLNPFFCLAKGYLRSFYFSVPRYLFIEFVLEFHFLFFFYNRHRPSPALRARFLGTPYCHRVHPLLLHNVRHTPMLKLFTQWRDECSRGHCL